MYLPVSTCNRSPNFSKSNSVIYALTHTWTCLLFPQKPAPRPNIPFPHNLKTNYRGTDVQTYTIKKYTLLNLCGYIIRIFKMFHTRALN